MALGVFYVPALQLVTNHVDSLRKVQLCGFILDESFGYWKAIGSVGWTKLGAPDI